MVWLLSLLVKLNKKTNTPVYAILLTAVLVLIALALPLNSLVEGASTVILTILYFN